MNLKGHGKWFVNQIKKSSKKWDVITKNMSDDIIHKSTEKCICPFVKTDCLQKVMRK